jgi:hypothetical protein
MIEKIWSIVAASYRTNYVDNYLRDGYEPFSATNEPNGDHLIWLKKLIEIEKFK